MNRPFVWDSFNESFTRFECCFFKQILSSLKKVLVGTLSDEQTLSCRVLHANCKGSLGGESREPIRVLALTFYRECSSLTDPKGK